MKDARDLFIDIRIELRKLQRDFHKTDLCKRLDETIYQLGRPQRPAAATTATAVPSAAPAAIQENPDAFALALAWQAAAQQLKDSEPAIHAELCRAVMLRMGLAVAPPAASAERGTGLDPVVPGAAAETLAAAQSAPHSAVAEAADDGELTEVILVAIAAGERSLSEVQREIAVGEAVVLSGFEVDPEQLIAKGDAEIARVLIELREREPAD